MSETRDKDGCLHSFNDEPAKVYYDIKEWYCRGRLHRDNDKPARITEGGKMEYWVNGKRHRDLGPAIVRSNGFDSWYKNGICIFEYKFR